VPLPAGTASRQWPSSLLLPPLPLLWTPRLLLMIMSDRRTFFDCSSATDRRFVGYQLAMVRAQTSM